MMRGKSLRQLPLVLALSALFVPQPMWAQTEDAHAGFACVAECQTRFARDFAPYEACLEADVAQRREKIESECIVYVEGSQERQECFRQVFQEGTDCRLETDLGSCVRGCVAARVWSRDRGQGR